jgi:hypothetical protein
LVVLALNALFLSLHGAVGGLSAIEFGIAVDLNQDFGFAQENVDELGNYPSPAAPSQESITTRHEQVAAEIDVHAQMLPVMGQRLDLVLHRVGQRRKRMTPSASAPASGWQSPHFSAAPNHRLSIKISSLTKFKCGPRCCAPPVRVSTSASIAMARSPILIVPRSPMSAAPVSASRNALVNAP